MIPTKQLLHREYRNLVTGNEAYYVVDMPAETVKKITTGIEDKHELGRLFDMDVYAGDHTCLSRDNVGGGSRDCIVCGAPGRGCASRRLHSLEELRSAVSEILLGYFRKADAFVIGTYAVRSLLEEVSTTPKPGLVDRRNSGSHQDMDFSTFQAGANSLHGYFIECAEIGMKTAGDDPDATFPLLRKAGILAEGDMYTATGGVNTHKGAIFTLGLICGAAGRLWDGQLSWEAEALLQEVAAMTGEAMKDDWQRGGDTAGSRLFSGFGIRGIRGEVADGLPSLREIGLPVFRRCLMESGDRNWAGVQTLLHLITRVEDTNMISRGGIQGAREAAAEVSNLLNSGITPASVEKLDDWFIQRNLSPGGCADLLAAVYLVYSLEKGLESH